MRAVICSELTGIDGLHVGDMPEPELVPGSARIEVEAAGVNFPDLLVIQGLYQDQPELPFAPGMEMAGTVTEIADDVSSVAVGDRVFGFIRHGAFAEQTVTPASSLFPIPDTIGSDIAAALTIAYGTSYHALVDRAQLAEGETLLVLGAAGGVGMAAVQIGAALGARVVAAVSSADKAEAVTASGAATVIRYDETDLRTALKELAPGGVDVVYDPVGGDTTETAFRSLAWNGRHLVVGFAAGSIPALPVNLTLLKGASLVGVFWGRFAAAEPERNRENFETLTEWTTEGRINPVISEHFPLDRTSEALSRLQKRGAIGKLIVTPNN